MPNQINSIPKYYDAGEMADVYSEMLERAEAIGYMVDMLRKEINILPDLTGKEKIFFLSITRCANVLEQLSYDNMRALACDEERLSKEWEANKKAVAL